MRKFLIPLLMANVVLPAAANARPDNNDSRHEQSSDRRSERSSAERPQRADHVQRTEHVQRAERPVRAERSNHGLRIEQRQVQPVQRQQEVRQVRRSDRGPAEAIRRVNRDERSRTVVRRHTDGGFSGVPQRTVERHVRTSDHQRWSSDWRRDHRYDWRNYRNSHRSLFRLSRYFDPYGWGYRRFSIGFNLGSSYYGSNYWLDDPWMYRLPPAYGPYRWVRYYDDALLVNIYTGQVADVLYNFFW
jgi:hypothetical protein